MKIQKKSNIVLIGMPGSGKSTIGVILAKETSLSFVDTDVLIQTSQGRSLQSIVDGEGHISLRKIEAEIILGLDCSRHVIATGGSATYSRAAMDHLKINGTVVFLDTDLPTLESRIHNMTTRGLAKHPDQSFADLFNERYPLYMKYADIILPCSGLNQEEVCGKIMSVISA